MGASPASSQYHSTSSSITPRQKTHGKLPMNKLKRDYRGPGMTLDNDPVMRLPSRPTTTATTAGGSRGSIIFGDKLASSSLNYVSGSQDGGRKGRNAWSRSSSLRDSEHDDVESDDQILLSQDSSKKVKERTVVDAKGRTVTEVDPETKTSNLKGLSMRNGKTKKAPERSNTIDITSEEGKKTSLKPKSSTADTNVTKTNTKNHFDPYESDPPPKPRPRPVAKSKKNTSFSKEPSIELVESKPKPRPKPKPKPKAAPAPFPLASSSTSRFSPEPTSSTLVTNGSPKQPAPFPISSLRRSSRSPTPPPAVRPPRKPAAFPMDVGSNGRASRTSNSLTPPPKLRGKDDSEDEDSFGRKTRKRSKPQTKKQPAEFPMNSSLNLVKPDDKRKPKPKAKASVKGKGRVIYSDEDDDSEGDIKAKAAPFPLLGETLGRDSLSFSKQRKKRHSSSDDSSDDSSPRKKSKGAPEDYSYAEESSFLVSTADPKTLCPFCDNPLPPSPSPTLLALLENTKRKSYPDPRPANPLGRKAPFTKFIALCQRHQFESDILPEAEAKGWPKEINWNALEGRIAMMKGKLQEIIDDDSGWDVDNEEGKEEEVLKGPRAMCEAWKEIMEVVKKKGSRAATGVKDQFANFEKTQPGYYGELGSFIIHQTLYNLFPPSSIDASSIRPLSAEEFIQRVLIPEVALRLIMQDRGLDPERPKSRPKALRVLRESSAYGVAMFPADATAISTASGSGGREVGGHAASGNKNGKKRGGKGVEDAVEVLVTGNMKEGLTAGESIMMERARKRRIEIEEEERREEEERVKEAKAAASAARGEKELEKVRAKEREGGARPRPRPIPKGGSSMMDVDVDAVDDADGVDMGGDTDPIECPVGGDTDVDIDSYSDAGRGQKKARTIKADTSKELSTERALGKRTSSRNPSGSKPTSRRLTDFEEEDDDDNDDVGEANDSDYESTSRSRKKLKPTTTTSQLPSRRPSRSRAPGSSSTRPSRQGTPPPTIAPASNSSPTSSIISIADDESDSNANEAAMKTPRPRRPREKKRVEVDTLRFHDDDDALEVDETPKPPSRVKERVPPSSSSSTNTTSSRVANVDGCPGSNSSGSGTRGVAQPDSKLGPLARVRLNRARREAEAEAAKKEQEQQRQPRKVKPAAPSSRGSESEGDGGWEANLRGDGLGKTRKTSSSGAGGGVGKSKKGDVRKRRGGEGSDSDPNNWLLKNSSSSGDDDDL